LAVFGRWSWWGLHDGGGPRTIRGGVRDRHLDIHGEVEAGWTTGPARGNGGLNVKEVGSWLTALNCRTAEPVVVLVVSPSALMPPEKLVG
jgi:hypothetical protein